MKTIKTIFWIFIGVLIISVIGMAKYISKLNEEIGIYDNNFKALNLENDKNKNYAIAYKFSTEQLNYINDSIITELNNTRKQLKIKDKELKQLQSIKTEVHIRDSVFIRDTIFKESFIRLDTLLGDEWYKTKLTLEYPNKIGVDMTYKSDISVIASTQKEIIGTPKKCFIGRWFQKKQKVIRVDVMDSNPYSEIKSKKFVIVE
jgi:hypothetical protein